MSSIVEQELNKTISLFASVNAESVPVVLEDNSFYDRPFTWNLVNDGIKFAISKSLKTSVWIMAMPENPQDREELRQIKQDIEYSGYGLTYSYSFGFMGKMYTLRYTHYYYARYSIRPTPIEHKTEMKKMPNHITDILHKENNECTICYENVERSNFVVSSCGHNYCTDCFSKIDKCAICRN